MVKLFSAPVPACYTKTSTSKVLKHEIYHIIFLFHYHSLVNNVIVTKTSTSKVLKHEIYHIMDFLISLPFSSY